MKTAGSKRRGKESEAREETVGSEGPLELALIGDLTEHEADCYDKLLGIPTGSECTIYFNSPGGSAYTAISLMTLIRMRQLCVTGIVTGECSSAALWPFAACTRRLVTPFSVLLFHPMKWQSEEHVQLDEAAEWARHFGRLERDMDELLASQLGIPYEKLQEWMRPGRYVSGPEFVAAGLAELCEVLTDNSRGNRCTNG
jgi:ATP-dependent protease ClpP protease subunit